MMSEEKEDSQSQSYRIIKPLGKGCQAQVFEIEDSTSLEHFALKVIQTRGMQPKEIERVQFELQSNLYLSTQLRSNHFPKLHTYFHRPHSIQILFELCDDNADTAFKRLPSYTLRYNFVFVMMHDLLHALKQLEPLQIMHRDIKPENILLKAGHFKLADLGLSRLASHNSCFTNNIGNRLGRSPQFITGKYSQKADIWSLGIHCFYLFESTLPFDQTSLAKIKNNPNDIEKIVSSDELQVDLQAAGRRSRNVLSFIHLLLSDMLVIDPTCRSSASRLVDQYFSPRSADIQHSADLIRSLLVSYLAQREAYGQFYLVLLLGHYEFYRMDTRVKEETHPNKRYICLKIKNAICQILRLLALRCAPQITHNPTLATTTTWLVELWQKDLGLNLQTGAKLEDVDEVLELYKIGKVREKFPLLEWIVKLFKIASMRAQGLQPVRLHLWDIPLELYKMI